LVWWGLFGAVGAAIPRRDRRSNDCIPLGTVDKATGKLLYLRLPLGEEDRYWHAGMDAVIESAVAGEWAGLQGLGQWYGGQIPGANPLAELAVQAAVLATGGTPYDTFRGGPVPGTDRGPTAARWRAMGLHGYNQTLGALVGRVYVDTLRTQPTTEIERFLRLPVVSPTLGRWLRVSNGGLWERAEELSLPAQRREELMRWEVERAYQAARAGDTVDGEVAERIERGRLLARLHGRARELPDEEELDRRYWVYWLEVDRRAATIEAGPEAATIEAQPSRLQRRAVERGLLGR
jgi:hypothetical protein